MRKLKTIGLFAPQIVSGELLNHELSRSIYQKLRELGFQETKWQYIYDGQVAGIVLPYLDGRNEVHVRFYEDRIFAELEIGRAYVSHFLAPLLNANRYLENVLTDSLNKDERQFLYSSLLENRQRDDERRMQIWNFQTEPAPSLIKLRLRGEGSFRSIIRFGISRFGWWHLTLCFAVIGCALSMGQVADLGLSLTLLGLISVFFIPTVGKP